MRVRTTTGGLNGNPSVTTTSGVTGTTLNHVVMTHDATGNDVIYVNGVVEFSGSRTGDFSNWNAAYALALGNEFSMDRAWLGDYHLAAIYSQALSAAEVTQNFNAGAGGNQLVVDTTSDVSDGDTASIAALVSNRGADGFISLREAIIATNNTVGTDTIAFDIAGAGPHTISVLSALPTITDALVINGTTEPDFAGTPVIELDGIGAGLGVSGLVLGGGSGGSEIRGLAIQNFDLSGILVQSASNLIAGNYLGLDADGTTVMGNNIDGGGLFRWDLAYGSRCNGEPGAWELHWHGCEWNTRSREYPRRH
jgi:hypothetical protein